MFKKCTLIDAIKIVGDMIGFDFSSYQNSLKNTQYDSKTKYLYDSIKNANDFFIASLNDKKNMHIMSYLSKRGINEETIKHFKIGYAPATNMLNKILTNKNNMFGSDYDKNLI
jgi:DNA primase